MVLTKEEVIRRHRLMWNWISEETIKQERCVGKVEASEHFGWCSDICYNYFCWCCVYAHNDCSKCPVKWTRSSKCSSDIYKTWQIYCDYNDYLSASEVAKRISELPEREDV